MLSTNQNSKLKFQELELGVCPSSSSSSFRRKELEDQVPVPAALTTHASLSLTHLRPYHDPLLPIQLFSKQRPILRCRLGHAREFSKPYSNKPSSFNGLYKSPAIQPADILACFFGIFIDLASLTLLTSIDIHTAPFSLVYVFKSSLILFPKQKRQQEGSSI